MSSKSIDYTLYTVTVGLPAEAELIFNRFAILKAIEKWRASGGRNRFQSSNKDLPSTVSKLSPRRHLKNQEVVLSDLLPQTESRRVRELPSCR
jgi:hypothetical protein